MKILVAIPNYNNARYICEAIDSVLNQKVDEASIDIVVFDNKSTDNSVDLIRSFYGDRINVIVNPTNVGAVQNHNLCIDYAERNNFDYLKLLSSDDVLCANIISEQYHILKDNVSAAVISCGMILTDELLVPLSKYSFFPSVDTTKRFICVDGNTVIKKCAVRGVNFIGNPSSLLIKVRMINGVRFNTSFRWISDLTFASELLVNRDFLYFTGEGIYYRRHGNTDSSSIGRVSGLQFREYQLYCKRYNGGGVGYISNVRHYIKSKCKLFFLSLWS